MSLWLVAAFALALMFDFVNGFHDAANSIATIVTLDIFRPWKGQDWSEQRLVNFGRWAGGIGLLIGALAAPLVMHWENIFRYCQDLWAPMAAPVVTVFLAGALWRGARHRGAVVCLWMAILTVPLTLAKQILGDWNIHLLPANLENSLVLAGTVFLVSVAAMAFFSARILTRSAALATGVVAIPLVVLGIVSPIATAVLVLIVAVLFLAALMPPARIAGTGLWDRSMFRLPPGERQRWYANLWLWWMLISAMMAIIYYSFW